ncbi:MAG: FAD:protein FMN transferase [Arachnia sp.]
MSLPLVFEAMGTAVSLRTASGLPDEAATAVRDAFRVLEDRFSLWLPTSEASRLARREITLTHTSREFRSVYDQAVSWREATRGAFTPHRPDGTVDLSGIVKALAIRDSGRALAQAGIHDWCLNAGGDVLVDGAQASGEPWVVGIVDPQQREAMLSQFVSSPGRRAVATSGTAERGEHVWRVGADDTFVQVSVCAADIVSADVLATAILAGGPATLELAQDLADIDVLACTPGERIWASAAFLTEAA